VGDGTDEGADVDTPQPKYGDAAPRLRPVVTSGCDKFLHLGVVRVHDDHCKRAERLE
jgi:hypothetical protein